MFDLATYADLQRVVGDPEYAKEKHLIVKQVKTLKLMHLEDEIKGVKADDPDWRTTVDTIKSKMAEEKCNCKKYLIKYDKEYINDGNVTHLGLFRSVVTDGKRIYSFAPPKSLPLSHFKLLGTFGASGDDGAKFEYQEFAEGTMINLFYDSEVDNWEIASRSNVGARCKFYQESTMTFREMFLDAMTHMGLEFEMLSKCYCYSFVLQHPENRIVLPFRTPCLILTNVYKCDGPKVAAIPLTPQSVTSTPWISKAGSYLVRTPRSLNAILECSEPDLNIDCVCAKIVSGNDLDYRLMGAVVYNAANGSRVKFRNPHYERVRYLKGNSPKLQFQYYNLRQIGLVSEYLKFYPEHRNMLSQFRDQLHSWTHALWRNYIRCFVNKEKTLKEFPFEFKSHMYKLHQYYIDNLRPFGRCVSPAVTIQYVNTLPPAYLMSSINYPLRKVHLDQKKDSVLSSLTSR